MACKFAGAAITALLFAGSVWPSAARAEFPEHPITMVVPFGAGGGTDVAARILADGMSKQIGQSIVVENKVGGGGSLGALSVVNAKPDGYTILFTSSGLVVDQAMSKSAAVEVARDLTSVAIPLEADLGIMVNPQLPVKSMKELIDYAKAHPGELRYGSGGIGTTIHVAFESFKAEKGLDIVHIPYPGGSAATTAAISGEVQVLMLDAVYSKPQIEAGKLRLLGTGGANVSPFFKDYPTIASAAEMPGYEANYWVGIFLPKGADRQIVDLYREKLETVLADQEIAGKLAGLGFKVMLGSGATADKRMADELGRWQKVVTDAKIEKR